MSYIFKFFIFSQDFVYRHPGRNVSAKANEYLMHWLVSRELFISQYISRREFIVGYYLSIDAKMLDFCWHRNVIWPDRLPEKHVVFISLEDQVTREIMFFVYFYKHT
jgi:hypothetical protein